MFSFLSSKFKRPNFRKVSTKGSRYVERDDLDVKYKKDVLKEATKPLCSDMKHKSTYDDKNRITMKVKVVMTKREAKMLFSKCDSKGTLKFQDVATELTQIPADRVSVISPCSPKSNIMLESIPEEL